MGMGNNGNQTPTSCVLAIKIHDLPEAALRQHLAPFQNFDDNFNMFIQTKKQLAFVQFPNLEASQQCLDFINSGNISAPSNRALTAQYSTRQEVTKRDDQPMHQSNNNGPIMTDGGMINTMSGNNMGNGGQGTNFIHSGVKRALDGNMLNNASAVVGLPFGNGAKRPNNNGMSSQTQFMPFTSSPPQPVQQGCVANTASPVLCIKGDLAEEEMLVFLQELAQNNELPLPIDLMRVNGKNMCFVQYSSVQDAKNVLDHFSKNEYQTASNTVMMAAFSKRRSIERTAKSGQSIINHAGDMGTINSGSHTPSVAKKEADPSKVLIISLKAHGGQHYSLTAENILVPFSRYGMVQKVVVFTKKDKNTSEILGVEREMLQALVQYSTIEYAQLARERMDGQDVGEFRLMVRYSERAEIDVQRNCEKMRDFSNPWLDDGEQGGQVVL